MSDDIKVSNVFTAQKTVVTQSSERGNTKKLPNVKAAINLAKSTQYYYVRKSEYETANQIPFTNLDHAVKRCNEVSGYCVVDENGTLVHTSVKYGNAVYEVIQFPGKAITLNNTLVYPTSHDDTYKCVLTGLYYICDGVKIDERFRIVAKPEHVNKPDFVIGFIKGIDIVD